MNIIAIVNNKGGVGKTTSAVNLADHRLNVTEEIGQIIRSHYDDLVFRTEIRGNVRLKEAPSFGKSIFDYDHGSAGAEAYRALTKEVLKRIKKTMIS